MTITLQVVLFALLGLAVGSFLNVCIDRLPAGRSIVRGPSHCEACSQRLWVRDLVPLASYLWLRGRCRHCGAAIPLRVPLVELATALVFALLVWYFGGANPQLAMALVYACILIVIFVIDLEHGLILNVVIYPAIAIAIVFSFFWAGLDGFWPTLRIANALLGGAAGFVFMLIPYVASRGGMGAGDVWLAGFMGLVTGFPLVFIALLLGIVSGGLTAAALLITRVKKRRDAIPFGPFLAAATLVTILWGQHILDWYLGLI